MFTIKSLALAAVALSVSAGAFATPAPAVTHLGTFDVPSSHAINEVFIGSGTTFSDTFSFDTLVNSTGSVVLSNDGVDVDFSNAYYGAITNFTATLDGHSLTLSTRFGDVAGYPSQFLSLGLTNSFQLAAGHHVIVVSGDSDSDFGSYYSGAVNLTAPVPEPESYAMLLAGLGLMGAIAKRRKAKQA